LPAWTEWMDDIKCCVQNKKNSNKQKKKYQNFCSELSNLKLLRHKRIFRSREKMCVRFWPKWQTSSIKFKCSGVKNAKKHFVFKTSRNLNKKWESVWPINISYKEWPTNYCFRRIKKISNKLLWMDDLAFQI